METDFEYRFYPDVIADAGEPELISGNTPFPFGRTEYPVLKKGEETRTFQIVFEYHNSGPFSQVLIVENLLLVGHEGHFYLYDLHAKKCVQAVPPSSSRSGNC